MTQDMCCTDEADGVEYELTEFLLMATQDELNAANAIQAELNEHKRFMNMFDDARSASPDIADDDDEDEDVAGDAIDAALSASSFVASWINKPVNGCQGGEYGRTITPNENDGDAVEHAKLEQQLQGIEGVLSWRDVVTEQILVGLGLRQQTGQNEEKESASDPSSSKNAGHAAPPNSPTEAAKDFFKGQSATDAKDQAAGYETSTNVLYAPTDTREESKARRASIDGSERSVSSKNDVVIELVEKCLQTNRSNPNTPRSCALTPTNNSPKEGSVVFIDVRDDCSIPREIPVGVDSSERSVESKSDVIKKLAAKCLAMNKKEQTNEMQIEPDAHHIASPRQMGPPRPENPLLEQIQHAFDISAADLEVRDPPIGPDVCRDPPEIKPHSPSEAQQLLLRRRAMHMKWSSSNTVLAVKGPALHVETRNPREDNSLTLNIESTGRTPAYYSQPPRPETPFHGGEDFSRCMKRFTKFASSSFHKTSAEEYKLTQFKESALSSSAVLRRRHYKEMLMKERAAKKTAVE